MKAHYENLVLCIVIVLIIVAIRDKGKLDDGYVAIGAIIWLYNVIIPLASYFWKPSDDK